MAGSVQRVAVGQIEVRQRPSLEYRYQVPELGLSILAIQFVLPCTLLDKLLGDDHIPALRLMTKHVMGHQP